MDDRHIREVRKEIIEHDGDAILIGGRQIGKTETIVTTAISESLNGRNVLVVSPRSCQSSSIKDRIIEEKGDEKLRNITFKSSYALKDDYINTMPDVILVDEASFIHNSVLQTIDRYDAASKRVYCTTPTSSDSLIQQWAEYSPEHKTWHIPAIYSDLVDADVLYSRVESLTDEQIRYEVFGEYWSGDSPALPPHFEKTERFK